MAEKLIDSSLKFGSNLFSFLVFDEAQLLKLLLMVGSEGSHVLLKFTLKLGLLLSVLRLDSRHVLSMFLFKSCDLGMQLGHLVTCVS